MPINKTLHTNARRYCDLAEELGELQREYDQKQQHVAMLANKAKQKQKELIELEERLQQLQAVYGRYARLKELDGKIEARTQELKALNREFYQRKEP